MRAEAATLVRPGFTLGYDDTVWQERPAVPPVGLALACAPAACGVPALVTVIVDPRPLPGAGAAPFAPGAALAAAIDLRAQGVMPGVRLLAMAPAEPVRLGGCRAYRAAYEVEDRDLRKTALLDMLVPDGDASLHVQLRAPRLTEAARSRFEALLAGFSLSRACESR